jgi:hypothetical protein
MSTELTPIKGRIKVFSSEKRSKYERDEMLLTSFSGSKNGRMIQITLQANHIQLTSEQVKDLITTLTEWLD